MQTIINEFDFISHKKSLKDKNWFKTGGDASFYCEPVTVEQFSKAFEFSNKKNLDVFILGQGANLLVSDDGFDGIVIKPKLSFIKKTDLDDQYALVTAGAGADFNELIIFCLNNNLLGLEEFSGIPGTVGGSVFINIHYFEFLLSHFIFSGQVIEKVTGALLDVDNSWFNFGYNYSELHKNLHCLVSATFKLKKVDDVTIAHAKGRAEEIKRHRAKRYPPRNTCGSFFRNFYETEVNLLIDGKKIIFVAYYLDKIGVKGQLKIGGAVVSYQHANMIVTSENALSFDVIQVAKEMQELVFKNFGIIPQPECRLLGFKEYPLLR